MKLLVALAKANYFVDKSRSTVIVAFKQISASEPIPPNSAFVRLVLKKRWRLKDLDGVFPELDRIYVPDSSRGRGIGFKLLDATLDYMRSEGLSELYFQNFNVGFWDAAADVYPKNVSFKDDTKKRIGILKT